MPRINRAASTAIAGFLSMRFSANFAPTSIFSSVGSIFRSGSEGSITSGSSSLAPTPPTGASSTETDRGTGTRQNVEGTRFGTGIAERSPTLTALTVPEGVDAKTFRAGVRASGVQIAVGLRGYEAACVRVGHMGDIRMADVDLTLDVMESVLA